MGDEGGRDRGFQRERFRERGAAGKKKGKKKKIEVEHTKME